MKAGNFIIYTMLILLIVLFLKSYKEDLDYRKAHPSTSEYAIKPDIYLDNAKKDLKRHYYKTSKNDIDKAIKAMRLIENDFDSVSVISIETAIDDLKKVEVEIQNETYDKNLVYHAFSKSLNSLAYAQMRVSEHYVEENKKEEAIFALQYAILHLQNAMDFSSDSERVIEKQIYGTIDSLVRLKVLDKASFKSTVNSLLIEMDTTILPSLY